MSRVAVVTGGTRGIGEAISLRLKDAGYQVAAVYAGRDDRARSFSELTGIPAFKCDVANPDQCIEILTKYPTKSARWRLWSTMQELRAMPRCDG